MIEKFFTLYMALLKNLPKHLNRQNYLHNEKEPVVIISKKLWARYHWNKVFTKNVTKKKVNTNKVTKRKIAKNKVTSN